MRYPLLAAMACLAPQRHDVGNRAIDLGHKIHARCLNHRVYKVSLAISRGHQQQRFKNAHASAGAADHGIRAGLCSRCGVVEHSGHCRFFRGVQRRAQFGDRCLRHSTAGDVALHLMSTATRIRVNLAK